ncbi:4'-phosphopantetheinyl transferase family protein [Mucilaginibacter agri]|uniref:4'-phosphopantetheinyl transferase superfamily protein n=1 Tax=Mucilaginibacter agri TaxID=2695265 RepID=A0A965ZFP5_9SPHI|nr:4'-phosphopantetheinyl transferase superfamily protein [Mucilaginibacter agri]NCD69252.1 4'-phosphopantetheinyl transferase superfamily protein [Mucilaginibacter agri]
MISIGNDIVDLSAIDINRTQQKTFYTKILSETEQQLFRRTTLPIHVFVWLLWSAKESVYKFAKRLNPELVFSPTRVECIFGAELPKFEGFRNVDLESDSSKSKFDKFSDAANPASEKLFNFRATYKSQTYYLQSRITTDFIATLALKTKKSDHVFKGIKRIEQSDSQSQSAAVRECTLKRLNEVYPDGSNFSIGKSPVGYPIIFNEAKETSIKATFSHHGNYVAYSFGE